MIRNLLLKRNNEQKRRVNTLSSNNNNELVVLKRSRDHHPTEGLTTEPTSPTTVRLVVISDTHGHHELLNSKLPDGDILIHCGDFCNRGSHEDAVRFIDWLYSDVIGKKYPEIYVVDGNHDHQRKTKENNNKSTASQVGVDGDVARNVKQNCTENNTETNSFDLTALFSSKANNTQIMSNTRNTSSSSTTVVKLLQDECITTKRHGLTIFGASWESCEEGRFHPQIIQNNQVDIVMAHINPNLPRRYTVPQLGNPNYKGWLGDFNLFQMVIRHRVPLCLTGHVHWARGVVTVPHCDDPKTTAPPAATRTVPLQPPTNPSSFSTFINAASLKPGVQHHCHNHGDSTTNIMNKPVVIDYDLTTRQPIMIHCEVSY